MGSKHQGFKAKKCKKNGLYGHKMVFEPLFEAKISLAGRMIQDIDGRPASSGTRVFSGFLISPSQRRT